MYKLTRSIEKMFIDLINEYEIFTHTVSEEVQTNLFIRYTCFCVMLNRSKMKKL